MGQKKAAVHCKHTAADLTASGDGHIISANDNKDEDSPIAGQNGNSGGIILLAKPDKIWLCKKGVGLGNERAGRVDWSS